MSDFKLGNPIASLDGMFVVEVLKSEIILWFGKIEIGSLSKHAAFVETPKGRQELLNKHFHSVAVIPYIGDCGKSDKINLLKGLMCGLATTLTPTLTSRDFGSIPYVIWDTRYFELYSSIFHKPEYRNNMVIGDVVKSRNFLGLAHFTNTSEISSIALDYITDTLNYDSGVIQSAYYEVKDGEPFIRQEKWIAAKWRKLHEFFACHICKVASQQQCDCAMTEFHLIHDEIPIQYTDDD